MVGENGAAGGGVLVGGSALEGSQAPPERIGIFIKKVARPPTHPPGSGPESSERQGATLSRVEDLGLSWVKTVVVYICLSVAVCL